MTVWKDSDDIDVDCEYDAMLDSRRDHEWSKGEPGVVPLSIAWQNTSCSLCGKSLEAGDKIHDLFIFDFDGSLDYIELAHVGCVEDIS